MYYQPPRALGLLVGAAITFWALAVTILLLNFGLGASLGIAGLLAFVGAIAAGGLALLFAYWTYALATLSYALDRNGLVINWGTTKQVIPLGAIERLVPGTAIGVPRVEGVTWLGYHIGRASIQRIGDVLFYSTHQDPEQVLYVMTTERNYAISVPDPAAFAHEIQVRQDLGPTAEVTHHVERTGAAAQAFWHDPVGRSLAVIALGAGAMMWGVVAFRYPGLPATFELHFPAWQALPVPDIVEREAILELPRTATLVLGINLLVGLALHAWDRVAGYVLFIAAIVIQVGFVLAFQLALRGV